MWGSQTQCWVGNGAQGGRVLQGGKLCCLQGGLPMRLVETLWCPREGSAAPLPFLWLLLHGLGSSNLWLSQRGLQRGSGQASWALRPPQEPWAGR